MGGLLSNLCGSLFTCMVSGGNDNKEDDEYKKRIETTLTSMDEKIDSTRKDTKEEMKQLKDEVKEVKGDLKEGIRDLKMDMKFYYQTRRQNPNIVLD